MLASRDVGEGHHHARDRAVVPSVGQDPTDEPHAASSLHLPLDGREITQHLLNVTREPVVRRQRLQVVERTTDVARDHIEDRLGGRREETDLEVGVKKKRGDVGAVEHVLEVVRRRALLL